MTKKSYSLTHFSNYKKTPECCKNCVYLNYLVDNSYYTKSRYIVEEDCLEKSCLLNIFLPIKKQTCKKKLPIIEIKNKTHD